MARLKMESGPQGALQKYGMERLMADDDYNTRLLPALRWNFAQIVDGEFQDMTDKEAMEAWFAAVLTNGLNDIISRYDRDQAKKEAEAGLPPLP